ncbi:hypothetical protein CDAR_101771 [Caerostris darwini]|uniref:Uncharacterized protein n=1 Tax=Caerostris darwini TaxID=1538125 RepID=A0AAV4S8T8_9ARAC|nr:hypothetical protein CDAR_101771 [Caerostris darwini]
MSRNKEDVSVCLTFAVPHRNREASSMRFQCFFLVAEVPLSWFERHFSVRMFLNGERVPASSTGGVSVTSAFKDDALKMQPFFPHKNRLGKKFPISG